MRYATPHTIIVRGLMTFALAGLVLLPWRAGAEADGPATGAVTVKLTTRANHDHIDINTFYHGSTVSVQGDCAPDTDLVIKISAAEGETSLKQKGKVGGLLWMNVGDLHFSRVPGLYLLKSSGNIEEVVAPEEASRYVLGYDALKRHLGVEPAADAAERAEIVGQFIQYNEENKLFARQTGGIEFKNENGKRTYYTLFDWPYQAKPGDYVVDVYAVKDGRVVDTARAPVKVEQAGTVKYLAAMAKNNGALYGILSIVVALASGFGAGAIFRKQGGAH